LMVDTCDSNRVMAGEIFATACGTTNILGIIVDGPVGDTAQLQHTTVNIRMYASSITPYSGIVQNPGELQVPISCGGVIV
jgi:4-hydroxy-4-methyl-2-oxoglutarate aldolase